MLFNFCVQSTIFYERESEDWRCLCCLKTPLTSLLEKKTHKVNFQGRRERIKTVDSFGMTSFLINKLQIFYLCYLNIFSFQFYFFYFFITTLQTFFRYLLSSAMFSLWRNTALQSNHVISGAQAWMLLRFSIHFTSVSNPKTKHLWEHSRIIALNSSRLIKGTQNLCLAWWSSYLSTCTCADYFKLLIILCHFMRR